MKTRSLAIGLFLLAGTLTGAELVEKILARVNDRLITNSEFQKRMVAASHAPQASTDLMQIKREVLEDLIREKLLEERAKEMSVSASDEEIETAVERVKRQYNLATDQEFDAALASSNMTREDLKRQMRQTIILQKVIGRDVTSKLEISEDMLRLEYERQKEKLYRVPESARVAEIVIRFPANDPATREKAVARLEEARSKLAAGGGPLSRNWPRSTRRATRRTGAETSDPSRKESCFRRSMRRSSAILRRNIRRRHSSRPPSTFFTSPSVSRRDSRPSRT